MLEIRANRVEGKFFIQAFMSNIIFPSIYGSWQENYLRSIPVPLFSWGM